MTLDELLEEAARDGVLEVGGVDLRWLPFDGAHCTFIPNGTRRCAGGRHSGIGASEGCDGWCLALLTLLRLGARPTRAVRWLLRSLLTPDVPHELGAEPPRRCPGLGAPPMQYVSDLPM